MTPLPMSVVSGYLGAGKTTFINRLLAGDHGLRLMILVNDFGAINIDANLMTSASDDTIALTNGCVCCTMGADLFMALGDALDRRPRPDHLIVEASGVADPARIANAALAEPDLAYAGILTLVDGLQIQALSQDAMIGPQIRDQIACADLLVVSKLPTLPDALAQDLARISDAAAVLAQTAADPATLLFTRSNDAPTTGATPHPSYTGWSYTGDATVPRSKMEAVIATRPKSLFRLKGIIRDPDGSGWEAHAVGRHSNITAYTGALHTQVVAIGLAEQVVLADVDAWWRAATL